MDLTFAIQSFVALFLIVDAVGVVPIYVAILSKFKKEDHQRMIRNAAAIALMTLIFMTIGGQYIFKFLGVSTYSFRIAGGILLLIISIEMLFGRKTRTSAAQPEHYETEREDVIVTPMAIPLLTGPGAITTGIVLYESAGDIINKSILILNIILVFAISYLILSKFKEVYKILGGTGTRVITRIMGLLLSAIAVQFVISGIGEAIHAFGV